MTEYKLNHTIPRAMIEYWVDPSTPHRGVHVYDIKRQRKYVSTGEGKKPFSFAIVKDLHIPIVDGQRAVALEKWFSALEGALLAFIRQAHNKKEPITFRSKDSYAKTIMAIIGLEIRSPYNLRLIQAELDRNDYLRRLLAKGQDKSTKKQVLENVIHAVSEQMAYVLPVKLSVCHPPPGRSWILSDRPFVRRSVNPEGWRTVVLSNKVLLSYCRSEDEGGKYRYVEADEEMTEIFNKEVALSAREWIVTDSPTTLDKYAAVMASNEWRKRVTDDTISFLPIKCVLSASMRELSFKNK